MAGEEEGAAAAMSAHPYQLHIPLRSGAGTLTVPVRGTWSVTVALRGHADALLRCHQDGTVTEAALALIARDPIAQKPAYWWGFIPLGAGQAWHFSVAIDEGLSNATFNGDVKQPYVGEYAALTADGRVAV